MVTSWLPVWLDAVFLSKNVLVGDAQLRQNVPETLFPDEKRRLTVLVPGLVIVIVPVLVSILVIVLVTALVTVGCRTLFLSQNCYGHDYSL